ncbi:MAG: class I adenylate-forming enzyme family protein, partial [Chlamydiota bacterium]|nr:class I adenylate-forming enzyme family protein [Chlamydiota bacterium]
MRTLTHILDCSVQNYADNIALSMKGANHQISFTYRRLQEQAIQLAKSLKAKGLARGDTIALITPNTPIWGVIFFGVLYAGATIVPIDTKLKAHSVKAILEHANCKWIFISEDLKELLHDALDGICINPNIIIF